LDHKLGARLPELALGYESFGDLSRILEQVRVVYWPNYACPEQNVAAQTALGAAAETEARRLLYVALTRARDRLILEWPEYLEKRSNGSFWSLLSNHCRLVRDPSKHTDKRNALLAIDGEKIPCLASKGHVEIPEEIRYADPEKPRELPVTGRRAIRPASVPSELTPDSRKPSEMHEGCADTLKVLQERYGEGLVLNLNVHGADLGTFLHRCFEVLGTRPDLASRIPELTGIEAGPPAIEAIATGVEQFESWLACHIGSQEVLREWPLLMLDGSGSVISGTADLIACTATGVWVIDHKSDNIEDPAEAFQRYRNQLTAYAAALAAQDMHVLGVGINWIRLGVVTLSPMQSAGDHVQSSAPPR
jgi:ATP-dependent exoDNAse (exonuclease V) beta subunit